MTTIAAGTTTGSPAVGTTAFRSAAEVDAATRVRPPAGVRARRWAGYHAMRTAMAAQGLAGDPVAASFFAAGRRDPYATAELVRQQGRLVASSMGWVTADHTLAGEILKEHRRFGSTDVPGRPKPPLARIVNWLLWDTPAAGQGTTPRPGSYAASLPPDPLGAESVIGLDPPDHTRLRRLMSRAFTPRAIERMRPTVEQLTHRLLDDAARRQARGEGVDLMRDLAAPLPVAVIAAMLGIPDDDLDTIFQWGEALGDGLEIPSPALQARTEFSRVAIASYFAGLFEERRRHPGELVIDRLIAAADTPAGKGPDAEEAPMTPRELVGTASILLAAGFETTVNLLGNTFNALLLHPEQRRLLHADHGLVAGTVEETLRWDPPVQRELRRVRHDEEVVAGVPVPRGERLQILVSGTNRDPAVFDRPATFDITRENAAKHLSFGAGVHHCIGAPLSRLEGQVMLQAVLDRFPGFRASGPGRRAPRLVLRGMSSLPVDLGREAA